MQSFLVVHPEFRLMTNYAIIRSTRFAHSLPLVFKVRAFFVVIRRTCSHVGEITSLPFRRLAGTPGSEDLYKWISNLLCVCVCHVFWTSKTNDLFVTRLSGGGSR